MRSLNAELLTVVEVAQIFRVSKAMVYRMIRRGQLRAYLAAGRKVKAEDVWKELGI
jgi:excisionase family DNA binding protein